MRGSQTLICICSLSHCCLVSIKISSISYTVAVGGVFVHYKKNELHYKSLHFITDVFYLTASKAIKKRLSDQVNVTKDLLLLASFSLVFSLADLKIPLGFTSSSSFSLSPFFLAMSFCFFL